MQPHSRRSFLAHLAAITAVAVSDPERLLWQPGQRAYFDIHRQPVNTMLTPEWITRDFIEYLRPQTGLFTVTDRMVSWADQSRIQVIRPNFPN